MEMYFSPISWDNFNESGDLNANRSISPNNSGYLKRRKSIEDRIVV
jgi:hypothetical protein